ncbi:conserved Plasmodium protein, unknown function [Plasmodium malariae]|uniref:Uncharacterized protein n=1 Tax=Plasmodium malariae TaxID=5858 RepID=A0A1A8X6W8_PLAMA|nr:conserved Plasmodium protein, unknown function [Plasmodium malariae]
MADANDIIKEIIYRSADECNFNNEELNFPSILKYYYDVTNKYNIKKQLSDEIFNKLLTICKNIIEDQGTYEHPKRMLDAAVCENMSNSGSNTIDYSMNEDKLCYYRNYDCVATLNKENNGRRDVPLEKQKYEPYGGLGMREKYDPCRGLEACGKYETCGLYAPHDKRSSNRSSIVKIATLRKKENIEDADLIYNLCKNDKLGVFSIIKKKKKKDDAGDGYGSDNDSDDGYGNAADVDSGGKRFYKSICDINEERSSNKELVIDEKSFLHKNSRNLLKLFLNGNIICNVYKKIVKHNINKDDRNVLRVRKNKVKLYNESNILYTFYTLRRYYNALLNYLNKKKLIRNNFEKYTKMQNKKLLLKYYDLWNYKNEKKIYVRSVYENIFFKRQKKNMCLYMNVWINKYKKRKKKHFIYLLHIFNEWKNYAQRRRILREGKNKIERKKKKKFFLVWKSKYHKKIIKKGKNKQIENVYNKNLLIKCYIHLNLYCKHRKKEQGCYYVIHNYWKSKMWEKYFYLFLEIYQEEVFFKKYYNDYIKRVKIIFLRKFFSILTKHIEKRKKLYSCLNELKEKTKRNILKNYFKKFFYLYKEEQKFKGIIYIYDEKKIGFILKKFFSILKRHKDRTINLKKKFLFLYDKKNKDAIQIIFNKWKSYYFANSTKYIFLYSKYKYKLMIQSFDLLHKYKNYKKKRKSQVLQVNDYFLTKVKKKVIVNWLNYVHRYRKNILNYYNFNSEGNLFVLFLLKLLLKYQSISKMISCKSFFDLVNFQNININVNSLIYMHKKYFASKKIIQSANIFYDNVMFVYKSLNIIFSFIPVVFVVNLRKLRYNLPCLSVSIKLVSSRLCDVLHGLYKRIFDTWLSECRSIKVFKKKLEKNILKKFFLQYFYLIQKKKTLVNLKSNYHLIKKLKLKRYIFGRWFSLRMKYVTFRKNFKMYDYKNKEKRMRRILLTWLNMIKVKNLKKKKIIDHFKHLLMKKKKLYFNLFIEYVKKKKEKKIKKKISILYCMKKYKKKAFKALYIYTKNLIYFKSLRRMAESYLKGTCITKWKNLTKHFLNKREQLQNRLSYFYLKIQGKFFNILFIYVRLIKIKKKKLSHFKEIHEKFLSYNYLNKWKNYVKMKKNKKEFLSNMRSLFSRYKAAQQANAQTHTHAYTHS